ncbi:hypothetical protein Ahy_B10g102318 [Arachis hypogaea]|uniref:Uncharacterized protein n=1 Tax=Arachis hypogaea TaxID=3818 RepID=A0A444X1L1_ARAHY|nr:hypothetical protein Ahy_B10g102318 [Arachis hypogaea]
MNYFVSLAIRLNKGREFKFLAIHSVYNLCKLEGNVALITGRGRGIAIDDANPSILDNDVADFQRVFSVNITGPFLGIKYAARVMIPTKKGSIVNIRTVSSRVGEAATHANTSSKHGLIGLTKNAAAEL